MKILVASLVFTSFLLVGIRCDSGMSSQNDGDENSPGENEAPVKDAGHVRSTIIHAEPGNADESLVDQIKKLSEKIKVEQQKKKDEHQPSTSLGDADADQVKSTVVHDETGKPDETLVDQMQKLSEKLKTEQLKNDVENEQVNIYKRNARDVDNVPVDKTDDKDNDLKFENFEILEDDIDDDNDEPSESVMEQMLKLEQKINNGELGDSEQLKPSYDHADLLNDEDDLEVDELFAEIDSLGKSADEIFDGNDELTVEKTTLPKTDVLPSETMIAKDYGKDQSLTKEGNNAGATPALEQVKSTIQDSAIANEEIIMATTTVDNVESGSKTYSGQEKLKLRLEKHRKIETSETVQKVVNGISPTAMKLSSTAILDDRKISYNGDTRFVPTSQDIVDDVKSVEMSEDKPRGVMYETDVYKEVRKTVTATESISQEKLLTQTETKLNQGPTDTLDRMTVVSYDIKDQTESVKSTDTEMSEEEKLNMEKAQQYFEDGEKLINTSYKRDYVQAYEYFKLAADMGHTKALEYMGFGYLLGDYITMNPTKALETFQYLSDKGAPKGQLGLGFSYSSGLAVNSSQAKALIYFSFAALGGDPLAQMVLGYRYLSGVGVESKCETALTYYRKVATTVAEQTSSGSPIIQRIRLHEHAENKDNGPGSLMDDDLLQYYEFLADKGDVQAQVALGQLYYQGGRGVTVNHARAQHYFLMAAESGNGNALAFLGKMHSEGSPVIKQDSDLAFQYFLKAADKSNPIGQCGLGIMYLYGKGVTKDYQKALKYFSLSSDQGWSDAQLHLGIMHFGGKGLRRDYKMAVKYFNLASQGGHVLAFYHLAQMHATGTGVLRNCHTAVELYKNVAERGTWASMLVDAHELYKNGQVNEALLKYTFLAELGYEVAQTNVAYILDNGESTLFDEQETYQRALLHWTRAASQGSTVARLKMGDYHYYGYGTDIDYETAATHYRLATEQQHNAQAMFNLGYMHENGLGLKQDVHLAKRFYDMAAETSGDAYIPVTLALFKLGVFYGTEVFNKEIETYYSFINKLDVRYQLGPYWDIYLATFLAIILSIVVVVRQNR